MPLIKVHLDSNAREYGGWMGGVPEKIQLRLEAKATPMKSKTKRIVQSYLRPNRGVEEGVYRKSFKINDYSQTKWEICFQVFARKPHYRLTHLLEYGHDMILFRWGRGKRTKWGNVGMAKTATKRRPNAVTLEIPHIKYGQEYADKNFPILYDEGVNSVLTERMKRIK